MCSMFCKHSYFMQRERERVRGKEFLSLTWRRVTLLPLPKRWSTAHFNAAWLPLSLSMATATVSCFFSPFPLWLVIFQSRYILFFFYVEINFVVAKRENGFHKGQPQDVSLPSWGNFWSILVGFRQWILFQIHWGTKLSNEIHIAWILILIGCSFP